MRDWPYEAFPTGWYQVGYSAELKPGEVRPVKYFDQELVLYRTEAGELSLLDAYCPHLGANLGYGGKVKGDCIQCPFHGWEWNRDGSLGTIPYDPEANRRVKIPAWHTREVAGLMLTWYDGYGREPFWEWPGVAEFLDEENFYPVYPHGADHIGIRKIIPQSPVENTPDFEHFPYVHGAGRAGNPLEWDEKEHYLRTRVSFLFGANKAKTWMTPNGPVEGEIETEAWGLGLSNARFKVDEFITSQLTATTPIDAEYSQLFDTITVSREPGDTGDEPTGRAGRMLHFQKGQIRHDFAIWENQRYIEHPPFAGREADAYASFRRWSKQFYFGPNGESKPTNTQQKPSAAAK